MAGRGWIVGGAVVVAVVIVAAGSVGWAQQTPQAKVAPVTVPTPAVPVPPPKGALPLRLTLPQAAPLRTAGALAMPTPPAGVFGIVASATGGGGIFSDTANDAAAWLGTGGWGVQGYGNTGGGYFKSANASGYAYVGWNDWGIAAIGNAGGGLFGSNILSGLAYVGFGDYGIQASGNNAGGYFQSANASGWAKVGYGDYGIQAYGRDVGVYATASVGNSGTAGSFSGWIGVQAYGTNNGGYFANSPSSPTGSATLGAPSKGVEAYGTGYGGYFADKTSSPTGSAKLGYSGVGGNFTGTSFGIYATASSSVASSGMAGYFSGWAGVIAYGTGYGGYFVGTGTGAGIHASSASSGWAKLGYSTYKIYGTGGVSFVQNHPYDPTHIIVYSAPEGDEVATYTRGTAHLVNGEARVPLGETFAWVTNPDIGLTVYLTPVGDWSDLYVAEKTTSSIVVRSVHGPPDAVFDYIVWGLRIGFEEVGVVQEKEQEAYIPAMTTHEQLFQKHPELRRYTALARYEGDRAQILGAKALGLDLSASEKLKAAIGVFVPGVTSIDKGGKQVALQSANRPANLTQTGTGAVENPPGAGPTSVSTTAGEPQVVHAVIDPAADAYGRSFHSPQRELAYVVSVDDTVEPGDVLVAASDRPGVMRRAVTEGNPAVVGVVAAAPGVVLGEAADPTAASERSQAATGHADLAVSGIVRCKVDASYGPIRVGDLLVTSATPGHARVAKSPAPGTVVGKALEAFEAGTGAINVLVMLR